MVIVVTLISNAIHKFVVLEMLKEIQIILFQTDNAQLLLMEMSVKFTRTVLTAQGKLYYYYDEYKRCVP